MQYGGENNFNFKKNKKLCKHKTILKIFVEYVIIIQNAVRSWNKSSSNDSIKQMPCRMAELFSYTDKSLFEVGISYTGN